MSENLVEPVPHVLHFQEVRSSQPGRKVTAALVFRFDGIPDLLYRRPETQLRCVALELQQPGEFGTEIFGCNSIDQVGEGYRRKAAHLLDVANSEQGTRDAKIFLEPHLVLEQVVSRVATCRKAVVVTNGRRVEARRSKLPQRLGGTTCLQVFGGAVKPLEQGAVRSCEQVERLADVPAVAVDFVDDRILDHVSAPLDVD